LIDYQYSPNKLYDRFSIEEEITRRINMVNNVLNMMAQYEEDKVHSGYGRV